MCQGKCTPRFASGGTEFVRPVMTGTQDYGTDDPSIYPVTKPMMKFTAYNLVKLFICNLLFIYCAVMFHVTFYHIKTLKIIFNVTFYHMKT